jgi:hypothetical protein
MDEAVSSSLGYLGKCFHKTGKAGGARGRSRVQRLPDFCVWAMVPVMTVSKS